ncbi:GGDEF domain-containing protein [Candidatus Electrothrix sp.]|uniref:GGDEF domain-containing protein n=1 Tax=Candidatus Electrothrix sp. TaxID=2170559 RepID=UPI004056CA5E
MQIEIPGKLYKDFLDHIQEDYLSYNVSEHVQQVIIQHLMQRCHPGYDTDSLTKCGTSSQLRQDINRATCGEDWKDHSLYQERFLCIDIDNFKRFIDINGLPAGDEILVDIANKLRATYPKQKIYRVGSDEFVVIQQFPNPSQMLK